MCSVLTTIFAWDWIIWVITYPNLHCCYRALQFNIVLHAPRQWWGDSPAVLMFFFLLSLTAEWIHMPASPTWCLAGRLAYYPLTAPPNKNCFGQQRWYPVYFTDVFKTPDQQKKRKKEEKCIFFCLFVFLLILFWFFSDWPALFIYLFMFWFFFVFWSHLLHKHWLRRLWRNPASEENSRPCLHCSSV